MKCQDETLRKRDEKIPKCSYRKIISPCKAQIGWWSEIITPITTDRVHLVALYPILGDNEACRFKKIDKSAQGSQHTFKFRLKRIQ